MPHSGERPSFRRFVFAPPSIGGLFGAAIVGWVSLTPSLLPRSWLYQAAVLAVSAAFGYAIGSAIQWLTTALRDRRGDRPSSGRASWLLLAALLVVFVALALVFWPMWQTEQRALVEEGPVSSLAVLQFSALGFALTALLILIGRILGFLAVLLDRWLASWMPRALAYTLGTALFALAVYAITIDAVEQGFIGWANSTYSATDQGTREGDLQPLSPLRSGSPDSLASWETLGVEGRAFVSGGHPASVISEFTGTPAVEPIRVYAGLDSAPDTASRAKLLVDELDRTGAWDRKVVVIWSSTGTGWVDPDAAETAEFMFGGDTAIAAMQYSFLPSWISFLVDQSKAVESATAQFDAILERWDSLPEADRPELLLFGESLGSFGAEAAIGGEDLEISITEAEQTDGVVLLGPTDANVLWRQLIEARADDSPAWRPRSDQHPEVLVGNQVGELAPMPVDLDLGRIAYYHHPSDAVGYWNWETLWKPQRWAQDPIGYDVSPNIDWYPFVSFWHIVFAQIAGFSAPSGYGHNYAIDMPDVWAAVAAPEGWTHADSDRLRVHLQSFQGHDASS